ncbi:hypothetical protein E4U16_007516 [Claviceps sp. LM84 group G4]|nr:hypothetical protein E4U16_007516 [Claviceps sp. LM84 group G4]
MVRKRVDKRPRLCDDDLSDDIRRLTNTSVPAFDPRAMHNQIENHGAASLSQPLIPRFSLSPEPNRPNDLTTHGHYSSTPHQTENLDSLLQIELGGGQSTFAAQQSVDDAEGFATAESAAGDIPEVSPAVSIAAAEARLGPDVVHFPYDDCESEISWASDSGESIISSDATLPAEARSPEPVIRDDDTEDIEDNVFKMTEFLEARYPVWPPENTAKKEVKVPKEITLSAARLALSAAVLQANLSRKNYKAIIEAFKLFESVEEVRDIPDYLDTLRRQYLSSLPLLPMRRKTLTLDKKMIESRKTDKEDILMLDLESMVTRHLSSKRNQDAMISGLAHRTDGKVDHARQAQWWGESIRTTSGHCVRMEDDTVLFPSDFVMYWKEDDDCEDASTLFWGRICWVGQDFTDTAIQTGTSGSHMIEIQAVQEKRKLDDNIFTTKPNVKHSHCPENVTELIVIEDEKSMICPSRVHSRYTESDVHIDYDFEPDEPQTFSLSKSSARFRVRWFYNQAQRSWRHAMRTTPLRGEREIEVFGRDYLERYFTDEDMISLPMFLFTDGFGLYRNMYRAIEGLYLMPQYLPAADREKLTSLVPLALGPFGSSKTDIYKALNYICELEKGKYVYVNGRRKFVCVFIAAFVGDMMEQQELSGCMSHQASNGCRYCVVNKNVRGTMEFDLTKEGRFDPQLRRQSKKLRETTGVTESKQLMSRHGIKDEMLPCLDRIRSRPIDAAHSEYQGLSRVLLTLIYKDLLTSGSAVELDDQFRNIQFPPGWRRLQSGNSHLDSWRMLELAHGCMILPLALRGWLKDEHVKFPLRKILREQALKHFTKEEFRPYEEGSPYDPKQFTASQWIVTATWKWSQSLLYVCGPYSSEVATKLPGAILQGRAALSFLLSSLSMVERQKPQRQHKATKLVQTLGLTSVFPSQEAASDVARDSKSQAESDVLQDVLNQYDKKMNLPNIHAGVHLTEVAAMYGGCRMVLTLLGEAMHKLFKLLVLSTNSRDAASTLMWRTNVQLTLALVLQGAFANDYPEISKRFERLIETCPSLVKAMDPRAIDTDEGEYRKQGTTVKADMDHVNPSALHRQTQSLQLGADFIGITNKLKLDRSHQFFVKLRQAYERDYEKPHEVTLHQAWLRWYKKIAFTTRNQKRFCFTVGDFVKISKGLPVDDDTRYCRLEGIVAHREYYECHIFAVVRLARRRPQGTTDAKDVLIRGRPIHGLESEQEIVGLWRIEGEYIWMSDIGDGGLVQLEFDIDAR